MTSSLLGEGRLRTSRQSVVNVSDFVPHRPRQRDKGKTHNDLMLRVEKVLTEPIHQVSESAKGMLVVRGLTQGRV